MTVVSDQLYRMKRLAEDDLRLRITRGEPVFADGSSLPPGPLRVEVIGKSVGGLIAHVIYFDRAPYYFNVKVEPTYER